jgi:hypothetical protein
MVVGKMIMPGVVCLEDRLGIGQEKFNQQINQPRIINYFIYREPIYPAHHFYPRPNFEKFKSPSDMTREFHIIPGRLHWRAYRYV